MIIKLKIIIKRIFPKLLLLQLRKYRNILHLMSILSVHYYINRIVLAKGLYFIAMSGVQHLMKPVVHKKFTIPTPNEDHSLRLPMRSLFDTIQIVLTSTRSSRKLSKKRQQLRQK